MDLFLRATRQKLRFSTVQGNLSVEQLWDLPLKTTRQNTADLNTLAVQLDREVRDTGTVSFVDDNATPANSEAKLKFDVVLEIISVKKKDAETAAKAAETRQLKQRLLEIKSKKQDEALEGLSEAELDAKIAALS